MDYLKTVPHCARCRHWHASPSCLCGAVGGGGFHDQLHRCDVRLPDGRLAFKPARKPQHHKLADGTHRKAARYSP